MNELVKVTLRADYTGNVRRLVERVNIKKETNKMLYLENKNAHYWDTIRKAELGMTKKENSTKSHLEYYTYFHNPTPGEIAAVTREYKIYMSEEIQKRINLMNEWSIELKLIDTRE